MNAPADIHDLVHDLKNKGEAFAVATVVRTLSVTSAKAGAKAVITGEGTIGGGWIGGGCARAAVLKAAREAIEDGTPRLVSLRPEDLLDEEGVAPGELKDGARFSKNMCPGKGSMDIFVEAVRPKPELVIYGASPVAVALSDLARPLGLAVTVCAQAADHHRFSAAETLIEGFELSPSNGRRFIVIATQGSGDEAALKSALGASADYTGFVASRKKFAAVREKLIKDGIDETSLSTVRAPAGLDLKAITPEEIALSILAEVVLARRTGETALRQSARTADGAENPAASSGPGILERLAQALPGTGKADDHVFLKARGICC